MRVRIAPNHNRQPIRLLPAHPAGAPESPARDSDTQPGDACLWWTLSALGDLGQRKCRSKTRNPAPNGMTLGLLETAARPLLPRLYATH